MTKESVHRKILGKRVSNHVARSTVHEDNFTSGDTFTESMNTEINVFRALTVNRVLREEFTHTIIFMQRSRTRLRKAQVSEKATFPNKFISCFASRDKLSFTAVSVEDGWREAGMAAEQTSEESWFGK